MRYTIVKTLQYNASDGTPDTDLLCRAVNELMDQGWTPFQTPVFNIKSKNNALPIMIQVMVKEQNDNHNLPSN